MRLLPAVSDGKAVLESNYSIVEFSKKKCMSSPLLQCGCGRHNWKDRHPAEEV